MKFTRFHWCLCMVVTLAAAIVFFMIARQSDQEELFYFFSGICFLYAVFALVRMVVCRDHHRLDVIEDAQLYHTSCPSCGEMLAGHELFCPKCSAFLPKRGPMAEDAKEDDPSLLQ